MGRTVIAVYESAYTAKKAYSELLDLGCAQEYIALSTDDIRGKTLNLARAKSVHSEIVVNELQAGSAIGAGIGISIGIVGGIMLALGEINIPLLTSMANGTIPLFLEIAALTVIGLAVGSILGCLLSGLVGLGIPESEIERYAKTVHRSNVSLLVLADRYSVEEMIAVLEGHNPLEIQQKPIKWMEMKGKEKKLAEQGKNVHARKQDHSQ